MHLLAFRLTSSQVGLQLPYFLSAEVGEAPNTKLVYGDDALKSRLDALDAKQKAKAEISFEDCAWGTGHWT